METVRWTVVRFFESVFQAAPGEPVRPGASCQKCGQSIRYVVRLKSTAGEVIDVGRDCAVTLEGGPELAAIRRAEREYEHELYLASPEYRERQEREQSAKDAREALAAKAAEKHALPLACLEAILASDACSDWEKTAATALKGQLLGGWVRDLDDVTAEDRRTLGVAVRKAYLPASHHIGAVGQRLEVTATAEALIPVETAYGVSYVQRFRTSDGAVLVWFSKGGPVVKDDVGKAFRIRGTVKAHKEYKGEPQTALSRCKIEAA